MSVGVLRLQLPHAHSLASQECQRLQNWASTQAIIDALRSSTLRRRRRIWCRVSWWVACPGVPRAEAITVFTAALVSWALLETAAPGFRCCAGAGLRLPEPSPASDSTTSFFKRLLWGEPEMVHLEMGNQSAVKYRGSSLGAEPCVGSCGLGCSGPVMTGLGVQ